MNLPTVTLYLEVLDNSKRKLKSADITQWGFVPRLGDKISIMTFLRAWNADESNKQKLSDQRIEQIETEAEDTYNSASLHIETVNLHLDPHNELFIGVTLNYDE